MFLPNNCSADYADDNTAYLKGNGIHIIKIGLEQS